MNQLLQTAAIEDLTNNAERIGESTELQESQLRTFAKSTELQVLNAVVQHKIDFNKYERDAKYENNN